MESSFIKRSQLFFIGVFFRGDLQTLSSVTVVAESVRWRQAAVHSALLLGGYSHAHHNQRVSVSLHIC